jgi:plastocyanin
VPLMNINMTADDGSFDSGTVDPGSTFEMTFNEAGEIPYYCQFRGGPGDQGMSGIITVTSP